MLVRQNAAVVTGVAYSRCGDFALSEDIAQEAFFEAWKNLGTIREPEKFPGWICTIARRRAIDAVRSAKAACVEIPISDVASQLPDHKQLAPEVNMSQQQERELVWSMLARLPEAYREPMILFYRCEESTRDVALALGETEASIRQRLKRGREMLRSEMGDTIRNAIMETAPKATFAAMVAASLPSTAYAAGTAVSIATAAKSGGGVGTAATTAISSATLGSLIGIAGGVLGTFMSWKYCEYESQRKFILRQTRDFIVGLVVFLVLLKVLVGARMQGGIPDELVYGSLLGGLILGSQVLNLIWIWRGIRGYKRVGDEAKKRGEPMRQQAWERAEAYREQTQGTSAGSTTSPEAFQWNAGGWFGSLLGATAWLVPLGIAAFSYGAISLGILASSCFFIAVILGSMAWRFRERLDAYIANQNLVVVVCLMTVFALLGIQFLGNAELRTYVRWSPWGWGILCLFPMAFLQLWLRKRAFQNQVLSSICSGAPRDGESS